MENSTPDTPPTTASSWWTQTYGDYKPYGEYTPYDKLKFEDLQIYSPDMSGLIKGMSNNTPLQTNLPVNTWLQRNPQQNFDYASMYVPMFQQYTPPQVAVQRPAFSGYGQT